MIKAIEILKLFLNSLSHLINVNSTVDNGDSTYTLFVDNTYYLTINKTITINNIDYIVVDFELNKWIKLKGSTIPAVNEFTIPNPAFLHGTPIMVNNEHSMQNDYPLIWLVEFLEINFNNDFAKNETARLDLNLLFLTDINYEDWIVEDHYKYAIYPMQNEINFIISAIKKRGDLFGDFDEYKIINHVNFGQYITDKGYTKQIISDQLSGCQLKLTLPYVIDVCSDIKKIIYKSLPATVKNSDGSYSLIAPCGQSVLLPDVTHTDSNGNQVTLPAMIPFVATPCTTPPTPPTPSTPLFIPLSFTGNNVSKYISDIPLTTICNYNNIYRNSIGMSFDYAIFSDQVVNSNNDFYLIADTNSVIGNKFFVAFGLKSDTGVNYSNLDYAMYFSNNSIMWFESGVNKGTIATLTANQTFSYSIEHDSANYEFKIYVNNVLVHTATHNYNGDDLAVKLLGRNPNNIICRHLGLVNGLRPVKQICAIGDSITYGRALTGLPQTNYIELTLNNISNSHFANILAVSGNVTSQMVATQLPILANNYDVSLTSNICTIMGGINDLRSGVSLSTIKTNLTTLINTAQSYGYTVKIMTVLRDFNTDWSDRYLLNDWIVANSSGADTVIDLRNTTLETDINLYESDQLHPLSAGMDVIATNLAQTF